MDKETVLAIDIGGSKLMVGMTDLQGNVLAKLHEPLTRNVDQKKLIEAIAVSAQKLVQQYPDTKAAGIAVPGLADSKKGIWRYACFSGIGDFPIADLLAERIKKPVFIGNDVNVCAYGERIYGNCTDVEDFLWITVSNGIGGGVVLRGEVYEGAYGFAGEIGHVMVEEKNGRLCPCGNHGCLEAQASGRVISEMYAGLAGITGLSAKDVAVRAYRGDLLAAQVYAIAGSYIGKAAAAAANLFNPAKIIFGGGVSMDLQLFYPALKDTVDRLLFKAANKELRIDGTKLGYDAALIGAAAIAWKGVGRSWS